MHKFIRQLATGAALVAAALLPQAQAATAVIDFEGDSLTGLYFPGDSFSQAGFVMTQLFDAGTVDVASALGPQAPTGNPTQFYTNLNDGALYFERAAGDTFTLNAFSAAFVPLNPPANPAQTIVIITELWYGDGGHTGFYWGLGNTASGASNYPFVTYDGLGDYAEFQNLSAMAFYACALTGSGACVDFTRNNAQFALDNITTTVVPEPGTIALMAVGLLALALRTRRSVR